MRQKEGSLKVEAVKPHRIVTVFGDLRITRCIETVMVSTVSFWMRTWYWIRVVRLTLR